MKKADQKLKGGGGLMGYLTGGPKYDEAWHFGPFISELLGRPLRSTSRRRTNSRWPRCGRRRSTCLFSSHLEAGNCFVQCAFCAAKSGSQSDEANYLSEAGNVLKKVSSSAAVEQLEKAVLL